MSVDRFCLGLRRSFGVGVRRVCWAAGLALSVAAVPAVARADENWEAAKAAFLTCLAQFPDVKAIHAKFKADGWRYEGNQSGLRIFTRNGFRAVAATQGTSQTASRCVVSSSRLTPDAVQGFAKTVLGQLEQARSLDLSDRGVQIAWEGRLRGKTLRLGVLPNAEFGVMRGAVVVLGEF